MTERCVLPSDSDLKPSWTALWQLPALMMGLSLLSLCAAAAQPEHARIWTFLPFSFLGNSLAPLPYDGAVIYLGAHYPLLLVIVVGVVGTVIIEQWNMQLLAHLLATDATRGFRRHPLTQSALRLYRRAPFWSLVCTCILPIVPHYPMRVLVALDRYPLWKYQLSVVIGRGGRYAWLGLIGWAIPIPGEWIALASLGALLLSVRGVRKMNRYEEPAPSGGG